MKYVVYAQIKPDLSRGIMNVLTKGPGNPVTKVQFIVNCGVDSEVSSLVRTSPVYCPAAMVSVCGG